MKRKKGSTDIDFGQRKRRGHLAHRTPLAVMAVAPADLHTDVQAELREYMQKHDLNRVFAGMVEAVLLEQPLNPYEFLVVHMLEKYGGQIDLRELGLRRIGSTATKTPFGGAGGANDDDVEDAKGPEKDSSDDESNSDEDVIVDTLPTFSMRTVNRRISVSAESSVDPRVLKAQWEAERRVYPKNDDEKRRLRLILCENLLFKRLDEQQFDIVLDALSPVLFHPGKTVIKQGSSGDLFYVVESGHPEVHVETNGVSKKVRVCMWCFVLRVRVCIEKRGVNVDPVL
jgi:cAMP-dependent protein kinase regulator